MKRFRWRQFMPLIIGLVGMIVIVVVIPAAVRYVGRAVGFPAKLVIDYDGKLGVMPTPWRNLAQGGEEPKAMLAEIIPEVRALKPEYIRLDHIYDAFNVVTKEGGQIRYNWAGLDSAVEQILATGAKPMLALSYMPVAISKTGSIIDPPADWNEWGQVVQATIEHYSGRRGKNLTDVIYEVWNEPDLFGSYKTYGDKNYLTMYEISARAANRATNVNRFEIGGAAVTALYQNWLERLIKFADQKNLRLDFMSWHRYSTDLERFEQDANTAREWAARIPAFVNLKFYVTEWGHDSANHTGYDTRFGAIHTIAGARTMTGKIQRAFVFEIKDGPGNEKLWGRWGILTHEKFGKPEKKPRYEALMFLNTLGRFRISLAGEGSWVKGLASTDENGNIKLMVVNYDPNGSHSESVPITFENLPSGNFRYTRKDFLGGSRTTPIATTSATWKTTEFFGANTATMISLDF